MDARNTIMLELEKNIESHFFSPIDEQTSNINFIQVALIFLNLHS